MKKDSENIFNKIDQYIHGVLPDDEINAIEKAIESSPETKDYLANELIVKSSLEELGLTAERDNVKNQVAQLERKLKIKKIAIASALVLALIVVVILYINHSNEYTHTSGDENTEYKTPSSMYNGVAVKEETEKQSSTQSIPKETKSSSVPAKQITSADKKPEATTDGIIRPVLDENKIDIISEISAINQTNKAIIQNSHQPAIEKEHQGAIVAEEKEECPDLTKMITVKTSKTSNSDATGVIQLHSSNAEIAYSIDREEFHNDGAFEYLEAGEYSVLLKNEKGCIDSITNIKIETNICNIEYEKLFNPARDVEWHIEMPNDKPFNYQIIGKYAHIFQEGNSLDGNNIIWDGLNKNGSVLEEGLYKVIVKYYNNETCIYNIGIVH